MGIVIEQTAFHVDKFDWRRSCGNHITDYRSTDFPIIIKIINFTRCVQRVVEAALQGPAVYSGVRNDVNAAEKSSSRTIFAESAEHC